MTFTQSSADTRLCMCVLDTTEYHRHHEYAQLSLSYTSYRTPKRQMERGYSCCFCYIASLSLSHSLSASGVGSHTKNRREVAWGAPKLSPLYPVSLSLALLPCSLVRSAAVSSAQQWWPVLCCAMSHALFWFLLTNNLQSIVGNLHSHYTLSSLLRRKTCRQHRKSLKRDP